MPPLLASDQKIIEKISDALLKENEVFFAGFINKNGRLIAGGFKSGMESIVSGQDREMLFLEDVLMASFRKEFDDHFGKVRYTVSKREKLTMISFSFESFVLMVSVDSAVSIEQETSKIEKIVLLG